MTPLITDGGIHPLDTDFRDQGGDAFLGFLRPNFRFPREAWTVTSTYVYPESLQRGAFRLMLPELSPDKLEAA